jgi:hypothetical protein
MQYVPTSYSITANGNTTSGRQLDLNWLRFLAKLSPANRQAAMQLDSRFAAGGCWFGLTPAQAFLTTKAT